MASAAASKSVERSTLLSEYRLDPNEAIQFRDGDVAKPWKKVALAIGLLALGSLLLSLGLGFWFTGQPNRESRTGLMHRQVSGRYMLVRGMPHVH